MGKGELYMKTGMTLGEKVKYLRKRLGMTQQELAGNDFTKSFISQIEKNEANPSLKSLQIIASRLDKSVSFFLDETQGVDDLERSPKVDQLIIMGQGFARHRDWPQAINCYEQALDLCSPSDFHRRGTCLYNLGSALWHNKERAKAANKLEEAIQEFQLAQNHLGLVNTQNLLGVLYADLGNWKESVNYLEQALELLEAQTNIDDDYLKLRILTNLSLGLCRLERLDEALGYIEGALSLCNETTDYYKFGELQMALAYIHKVNGQLPSALEATQKALRFFQAVGHQNRLPQVYVNLAIIHRWLNTEADIQAGLDYLHQAQQLVENSGLKDYQGEIYEEYGNLLLKQGQRQGAIAAYQQALDHQGDFSRRARLHLALSSAFHAEGDGEKTMIHLNEAGQALAQATGVDHKKLAELYSDLGLFYKELGQADQANTYLSKSVEIYREL
ncbi:MAG: tetratricopeptide repeat protein [Limnochordia bacterium]|jgi:tetratricopeptide (TPR) repeat protein